MWIDYRDIEKIRQRDAQRLKRELENELNYRFFVEDIVKKLNRELAFIMIALLIGYTGVEIAACLGVSNSTVTQYKKRLKKIIKKYFKSSN